MEKPKVRQYIGARYVPKPVGLWDESQQTEYEPLTVVYFNGASYTSRIPVPKGVDIHDTRYWVLSADYNSQMAFYREEVQHLVNTDFPEFKEQIDKRTVGYQIAHVDILLNATTGNDINDGINNPVKTFDRALAVANNNGSYDMRIIIGDTSNYTCNIDTFSGTLHVVGNGASLNFNKKVAFYNSHINLENITITCNERDGFYFDNSFVLLKNVIINGCRFNVYSGSLETDNCVFGAIRATKACLILGNTTLNGYSGMSYLLSIGECIGLITGSMKCYDTYVNENVKIFSFVGSDIMFNCGCQFNGNAFNGLTKLNNNNSRIQGKYDRLNALYPWVNDNGGMLYNQRGYPIPLKGTTKTINNFITAGYVTSEEGVKSLRFSFYDEYQYYNNVSVALSGVHIIYNDTNVEYTPTGDIVVDKSSANIIVDVPLPNDTTMPVNAIFVLRCAMTITYS